MWFYILPAYLFGLTLVSYLTGERTREETDGLLAFSMFVSFIAFACDIAYEQWNKHQERELEKSKAYFRWWKEMQKLDDDFPWGVQPNQVRFSGGGERRRRSPSTRRR